MTNLARLKLELSNREYYTEDEYKVFLDEQGLVPTEEYNKTTNQYALLNTVIEILQTLTNNLDYYMRVQTEFQTTTQAYKNLNDRIDELYKRIQLMPQYEQTASQITYLYHN